MRLGAVAAAEGGSAAVRDYGRTQERDHANGRRQAVAVARHLRVEPSHEMAPEARDEAAKLARLSGRAFDAEFARYMIEDHRKDIADFETEARGGGPVTRALATGTLPTLHKHLEIAERLAVKK